MTVQEAEILFRQIDNFSHNTKEESFILNELSKFITKQTISIDHIHYIASYYEKNNRYDLAIKHYELAITYWGYDVYSLYHLGLIYQYGKSSCGINIEKAKKYYEKVVEIGKYHRDYDDYLWFEMHSCIYVEANAHLAIIYKNESHHKHDDSYMKYVNYINEAYKYMKEEYKPCYNYDTNIVLMEKVEILNEEGNYEEACDALYRLIEDKLYCFNKYRNIEYFKEIEEVVYKFYELFEFDQYEIEVFDLFYLQHHKCLVKFTWEYQEHYIEFVEENGLMVVIFDNKRYRNIIDMVSKGNIGRVKLMNIMTLIDTWEVKKWKK